jgi:hypothetical protein
MPQKRLLMVGNKVSFYEAGIFYTTEKREPSTQYIPGSF